MMSCKEPISSSNKKSFQLNNLTHLILKTLWLLSGGNPNIVDEVTMMTSLSKFRYKWRQMVRLMDHEFKYLQLLYFHILKAKVN